MPRKTKAQLEAELAELRKQIESKPADKQPGMLQQWGPAGLAVVAMLGIMYWKNLRVDPTPTPGPKPASVEKVVETLQKELRKGHAETFEQAAELVKSKQLSTDKELFDFVQPALVSLRAEKQRPFDQMFQMSLPRGEDGTFSGKESEVEAFLRRIAKAW